MKIYFKKQFWREVHDLNLQMSQSCTQKYIRNPLKTTMSNKQVQRDCRRQDKILQKFLFLYTSNEQSKNEIKKRITGTSLMAQWLRIHLPMQGTWVRALVWEDPTCCGATKPMRQNYWACTLEPASHSYWAHVPQLLKPVRLEPVLCNKRSHHNEKPAHRNEDPTQTNK